MQSIKYHYLLIVLSGFTFFSCKNSAENKVSNQVTENARIYNGLRATMISKCGEAFENAQYLPLPFNHGIVVNEQKDTLDILILGLPVSEPFIHVLPLAYFETVENQIKRQFILAFPEDEKYQSLKIDSYNSFMRQNYPIKNIIDTWFANYRGLAKIRVNNWKDNFFAEELLLQGKYWEN